MSDESTFGQDVRFDSPRCWAWWPSSSEEKAECIDGMTGFAISFMNGEGDEKITPRVSSLSSSSLLLLFQQCCNLVMQQNCQSTTLCEKIWTLPDFRRYKMLVSPEYENAKADIMTKNSVLRHWRRRQGEADSLQGVIQQRVRASLEHSSSVHE